MNGDVPPKPQDTPPQGNNQPPADNLQAARIDATMKAVAENTTAAPHLPNVSIDQPHNPFNIPGKYDPNDIKAAKGMGLNADQVHYLEEGGAERFHQTMAYIAANPARLDGVKQIANVGIDAQNNPDKPFNPFQQPGEYDPAKIAYGKSVGFNSDQMHALEQYGPKDFNGMMDYLKQHPDQVQNMKYAANFVGYWETHGDLPTDPKAGPITNPSPEALQIAQKAGFDANQVNALRVFGGNNFNDTMNYISRHPDQKDAFQNLAKALVVWDSQMVAPPQQPGPKR